MSIMTDDECELLRKLLIPSLTLQRLQLFTHGLVASDHRNDEIAEAVSSWIRRERAERLRKDES